MTNAYFMERGNEMIEVKLVIGLVTIAFLLGFCIALITIGWMDRRRT